MLVNAVKCKECNATVYSRTDGDMRECSCGRTIVSGGQKYFRYDTAPQTQYEVTKINVDANADILYEDWYFMYDNLGLIKQDQSIEESQNVYILN